MPDEFTPDASLTKPETLTREDYHRAMDRIDGLSVLRGPINDRPSDPTDNAIWYDTTNDVWTVFDADSGEWDSAGVGGFGTRSVIEGDTAADVENELHTDATEVVVTGGDLEWRHTIDLPSETTLRFAAGVNVTIPDDHNLDIADGYGADVVSVIRARGESDAHVIGGHIDCSGIDIDGGLYDVYAGVWYDDCEDCTATDVEVTDVAQGLDDTSIYGRAYGLLCSESDDLTFDGCVGRRTGYEGLAARGNNRGITFIDCDGWDCDRQSLQAAAWVPDASGIVRDVEFIRCGGDKGVVVHGSQGYATDVRFIDCKSEYVALFENVLDVTVRGGTLDHVIIESTSGSDIGQQKLTISDVDFPETGEATRAAVEIRPQEPDARVNDVRIANCSNIDNRFLEVDFQEPEATVEDIRIQGCTHHSTSGNGATVVTNGGGAVEDLEISGSTITNTTYVVSGNVDGLDYHGNDGLAPRERFNYSNYDIEGVALRPQNEGEESTATADQQVTIADGETEQIPLTTEHDNTFDDLDVMSGNSVGVADPGRYRVMAYVRAFGTGGNDGRVNCFLRRNYSDWVYGDAYHGGDRVVARVDVTDHLERQDEITWHVANHSGSEITVDPLIANARLEVHRID